MQSETCIRKPWTYMRYCMPSIHDPPSALIPPELMSSGETLSYLGLEAGERLRVDYPAEKHGASL